MNKKFSTLFAVTILLTMSVVAATDMIQTADAVKAKGTYTAKYGQSTQNKVCGDRLCSEIPPEERQSMKQKASPTQNDAVQPQASNLNEIMDRMNKVHEKHQTQMMQMWQTMTPHEQSQMMQTMNQMITKMETMDMTQHMSMMGDMMKMDKQHMQHGQKMMMMQKQPTYNETLNPKQIEFPNILGFNDLHIHANRHLDPERSLGPTDHLLQTIVHHHCKVYDDMTAACLLFPYGMTDQAIRYDCSGHS